MLVDFSVSNSLTLMYFTILQPPPAPRARSKMESFVFVPDSTKAAKVQECVTMASDLSSVAELDREEATDKGIEVDVKAENVERPVDLYKVFSSHFLSFF